jgi:hypothetical protein
LIAPHDPLGLNDELYQRFIDWRGLVAFREKSWGVGQRPAAGLPILDLCQSPIRPD